MGRLPRFVLAGLLLYGTALALSWPHPGVAAAVFVPLWYFVAAVNGWLGVMSAGYPVREEIVAFLPVFGVPATVAGVIAWVFSGSSWPVEGVRVWLVLLAGVALWAATVLLIWLLGQTRTAAGAVGPAVLVFGPLWTLCCVGNLVGGLRAGHGIGSEILILLLNLAVPGVVALVAWRRAPALSVRRGAR